MAFDGRKNIHIPINEKYYPYRVRAMRKCIRYIVQYMRNSSLCETLQLQLIVSNFYRIKLHETQSIISQSESTERQRHDKEILEILVTYCVKNRQLI